MKNLSIVLVMVALASAGCAGASNGPTNQEGPRPSAPAVSATSGAIEGTVTTMDEQPLPGAQVAFYGAEADPIWTDAAGHFQFSNVDPGPHTIFVNVLGFLSEARSLSVAAAQLSQIDFRLQPLSATDPYSVLDVRDGFIACGTGGGKAGVGVTQVACGQNNPAQRFLFNYTVGPSLAGILFEMAWTPAEPLSRDLVLDVEKMGCDYSCGSSDTFAQIQGCCQIRLGLRADQLHLASGHLPAMDLQGKTGQIQTRTFPAFGDGAAPVTVFTGQDFRIYVEYFYNALPADFAMRSNVPS